MRALGAGDATALLLLRPDVPAVARTLRHPQAEIAARGADAASATVVGAAVWLLAAWLAVGLLVAWAGTLPGAVGRVGATASRVVLPRFLRTALAGSAGLGVLLAPAAALGQGPPGQPPPAAGAAAPTWPVETDGPGAPTWPTDTVPETVPSDRSAEAVTVAAGDSLWTIAAAGLGPGAAPAQVAAEWPKWFAANRAVIGDDPSLIRPGEVLQPPKREPKPQPAAPTTPESSR
jgi:hypothetical protein